MNAPTARRCTALCAGEGGAVGDGFVEGEVFAFGGEGDDAFEEEAAPLAVDGAGVAACADFGHGGVGGDDLAGGEGDDLVAVGGEEGVALVAEDEGLLGDFAAEGVGLGRALAGDGEGLEDAGDAVADDVDGFGFDGSEAHRLGEAEGVGVEVEGPGAVVGRGVHALDAHGGGVGGDGVGAQDGAGVHLHEEGGAALEIQAEPP